MNQISLQNVYETSSQANFKLGERAQTPDGRQWVYVRAQAAVLKGYLATPYSLAVTDVTSSSTDTLGRIVFINKSGAFVATNYFADGIGIVHGGTGAGQVFKIRSNTANQIEIDPATALGTALDSTSDVTLVASGYVGPTPASDKVSKCVGCAQVSISTGDYGWLLTNGDGVVNVLGTALVAGKGFTPGETTTAGNPLPAVTATGPFDAQNLGFCLVSAGTNVPALVRFNIR